MPRLAAVLWVSIAFMLTACGPRARSTGYEVYLRQWWVMTHGALEEPAREPGERDVWETNFGTYRVIKGVMWAIILDKGQPVWAGTFLWQTYCQDAGVMELVLVRFYGIGEPGEVGDWAEIDLLRLSKDGKRSLERLGQGYFGAAGREFVEWVEDIDGDGCKEIICLRPVDADTLETIDDFLNQTRLRWELVLMSTRPPYGRLLAQLLPPKVIPCSVYIRFAEGVLGVDVWLTVGEGEKAKIVKHGVIHGDQRGKWEYKVLYSESQTQRDKPG